MDRPTDICITRALMELRMNNLTVYCEIGSKLANYYYHRKVVCEAFMGFHEGSIRFCVCSKRFHKVQKGFPKMIN